MADENGPTFPPVAEELERLRAAATELDFFQLVRRLESLYTTHPRIGHAKHPRQEPVRFSQRPSTAFAPSAVAAFEPGTSLPPAEVKSFGPVPESDTGHVATNAHGSFEQPHLLQVAFTGLFGPNGPLPLPLTEEAQRRTAEAARYRRTDPFVDLVDMFHQRIFGLLYRAWASSRPTVQHDRPSESAFTRYLSALTGAGVEFAAHPDECEAYTRHFAGAYAHETRTAEGLEAVATALLQTPVVVEPFVGEWIDIPETYAWKLGDEVAANTELLGVLGASAMLGPEVYERQYKFRIVAGPVDQPGFQALLPGSDRLRRLRRLVQSYVGDELRWDLRVTLDERALGRFCLGEANALGDTTYLLADPADVLTDHLVDPFAT